MPIYEYFCADCRTKFEALRPMAQAGDKIACEACGGGHTARVLSVFAIKGGDGASVMDSPVGSGSCACGGACACGSH